MGTLVRETRPPEISAPDLRKGVLFIQFNLPTETVAAKQAEVQAYMDAHGGSGLPTGFASVMFGLIPLMAWGPQQTATQYEWDTDTITIDTYPGGTSDVDILVITGSQSKETPPSYVGVDVDHTGAMSLIFHLQTQESCSCSNTVSEGTGAHWDPPGSDAGTGHIVFDYADASYIDAAKPDYFGNANIDPDDGQHTGSFWFGRPTFTGTDTAHTVLISWDITDGAASHGVAPDAGSAIGTSAGVDTASKMWCAIDDVNKNGFDLPAMWAHGDTESGDPNEMLSFITQQVSGQYGGATGTPVAVLTTDASSVPFYPVSIPSKSTLMREGDAFTPNPKVRIKRVQLFTGVTLDTSVMASRRVFADADGNLASTETARTFFGRVPLVEFDGAVTLIAGANAGNGGNLTKDGTITNYSPAP